VRILFLSQLLPLPLDAGPKIRAYYVLRHLAEAGHTVTLLCFVRPSDRAADVRALRAFCRAVETVPMPRSRAKDFRAGLRSLVSASPFLILRDSVPDMYQRLSRLVDQGGFDAVHADQLWMAPYAIRCSSVRHRVLDQHNAVFRVPERLADHQAHAVLRMVLRREARNLASFEETVLDGFDQVVWVSDEDRRAFPGRTSSRAATDLVIPIAVDPSAQQPVERPRPFRVTFLGGVHWPPNAEGVNWFAERVWPTVMRAVPNAVFTVIGKGAAERLRTLPGVDLTGYVPNLDRHLAETAAFVVPLLTGAGMRVKILDAWCWGLPVVATSVGAEGTEAVHGENLLIGDDEEMFAESVIGVLKDPERARLLGRNGRTTVVERYDWRKVYRAWVSIYR
jgi:glycosyltransferase involved in cell wall biosynthesis